VTVAPPLATIGYEGTTLDHVLAALGEAGAVHLIDVRAVASSRKPGFSKSVLAASAGACGIAYTHLRALGTPKAGREAVRRGDPGTMRRIFAVHMESDAAQAALARAAAIAGEGPACLLCFERDHAHCHRAILADLIHERTGQTVRHLVPALPAPAPV
jgi:uncharacterized protein (DUF488 family)